MATERKNKADNGFDPESKCLTESQKGVPWKKWGPYLSERQWGTVREDYSDNGDAWNYFTHDHALSRAYQWGEDGLAGVSDDPQILCFALALWNGKDPIIKERIFGLPNGESNHGEDVKEYYFYLDSTPTHAYMKYLYKYPQAAYPYDELVGVNGGKNRHEFEYELIDTEIFDDNRYLDVEVEYAKDSPDDLCIQITVHNRGPEAAELHVIPTLWFRNTWSWGGKVTKPELSIHSGTTNKAAGTELGNRFLYCDENPTVAFTENETNNEKLFGTNNTSPYVKDGINAYVVQGKTEAVNPAKRGTKAAVIQKVQVESGKSQVVHLRLASTSNGKSKGALADQVRKVVESRKSEANAFYKTIIPSSLDPDQTNVMRQDLAGMLWSKFYVEKRLYEVCYLPSESDSGMFGGNSNWRRPIWMPVNALIIRALLQYYTYYGDNFLIEYPTGSGNRMNLYQVASELSRRLSSIFLKDANGKRPVYGGTTKFQEDPYWKDLIQFSEYFHGDNGAALGATHQTGWTGIVAHLMHRPSFRTMLHRIIPGLNRARISLFMRRKSC